MVILPERREGYISWLAIIHGESELTRNTLYSLQLFKGRSSQLMPSQKAIAIWVAIISAIAVIVGAIISRPWGKNREQELLSYTGRVVEDASSRPIPNATISLELGQDVPIATLTDDKGIFHFKTRQSSGSVRIRVDATGYDTLIRNVSLDRTSLEDVRLKSATVPDQTSINSTFPINPTVEQVRSQLANARGVRIDYGKSCRNSVKQAVVQLNGGQLTGKNIKEYLENAAIRSKVNFSVTVLSEGASYEIVCN